MNTPIRRLAYVVVAMFTADPALRRCEAITLRSNTS